MKNKAPLALMEQLIMLTVFALAAALCLQIFAFSGQISRSLETRDRAVTAVQNTAESIKIAGGDLKKHAAFFGGDTDGSSWQIAYNEAWEITSSDEAVYYVTAQKNKNTVPLLGSADIHAAKRSGEILFELTVAWQEEAP